MRENNYYQIYWEKTVQCEAKVLRVLGQMPAITIPDKIDGCPIVEIGDYCFAYEAHLPKQGYFISIYYENNSQPQTNHQDRTTTELCGSYIESICLPDSLRKIGNYAFYNCRNLKTLELGNKLNIVGSDAFMNCYKLQKLYIRCDALEPSILQKLFVQISWDIEVLFVGHYKQVKSQEKKIQASLFYTEYYDSYDEIAPAHIFEHQIIGSGFRARQSFLDNKVDYHQYDAIFLQSYKSESMQSMCHLALCRLRYPICLTPQTDAFYKNYIFSHGVTLVQYLSSQKELDILKFLFQKQLLSQDAIQAAILSASSAGWTEGCACMLRLQQQNAKQLIQNRYSLDF